MPLRSGPDEIIKMLQLMSAEEQTRLLSDMEKQDPKMASFLKENLYTLEDLVHMTPKMLQDFLRVVAVKDLGLALKIHSPRLRHYFLNELPKRIVEDLKHWMENSKVPKSEARTARDKVSKLMREMIDKGQLVLRQDDNDPMV